MGIEKLLNLLKNIGNREEKDELPDDVTRDRYLRSLRRERRMQLEEVEKEQLKKQIAEFKKERERKYLWGITDKEKVLKLKKKQKSLLSENQTWFNKGRTL